MQSINFTFTLSVFMFNIIAILVQFDKPNLLMYSEKQCFPLNPQESFSFGKYTKYTCHTKYTCYINYKDYIMPSITLMSSINIIQSITVMQYTENGCYTDVTLLKRSLST